MIKVSNELSIEKIDNHSSHAPLTYKVEQCILLNIQERVLEFCKGIFLSLLTITTAGYWKESRDLAIISWKRVWSNERKYYAIIDETFFKTQCVVLGFLKNKNKVSKELLSYCHFLSPKETSVLSQDEESLRIQEEKESLPQDKFSIQVEQDLHKTLEDNLSLRELSPIENTVNIIENLDVSSKQEIPEPIRQEATMPISETQLEKNSSKKMITPLLEFIEVSGRNFASYLKTKDKIALIETTKLLYQQNQVREEIKPLIEYINKITGFIEKAFPTCFKSAVFRNRLLNSHYLTNPLVDFDKKKNEVMRLLFNAFNDIFKNNEDLQKNKDLVLLMLSFDLGNFFNENHLKFTEFFLNDEEVMIATVQKNPKVYEQVSPELKLNKKIILETIKADPNMLKVVFLEGINTIDEKDKFIIYHTAVTVNGMALEHIPKNLSNYRDIVLAAVYHDGSALEFAPEFKDDEIIAFKAVEKDGMALEFFSDRIKSLKYIVLKAVSQNGLALEFLHVDLIYDLEVIKTALSNDAGAIQLIPNEFWEVDDLLFCAINTDGFIICFLDLTGEYKYAIEAVKQNADVYKVLVEELRDNNEIASVVFSNNGLMLEHASDEMADNKPLVLIAVKNNGLALRHATEDLLNDCEVVLAAVTNNGLALEFVSKQLQKNPQICMAAINNNGDALEFVDSSLYNEENLLKAFSTSKTKKSNSGFERAVANHRTNRKVILEAVKFDGLLLKFASNLLKNDVEIVMNAVKNKGLALDYVTEDIAGYKAIAIEALRQDSDAVKFIPKYLQDDEILKEQEQSKFINGIFPEKFA
ncbi:MAG: DUF4116 domain-containing protein [Parachlamydiaceae bacterium]|nr:DUF4116 domain-containing protein [Parachlamydiaceae bacterium]